MPRIIATGFPRSDLRTNPTTFASSFFGLSTSRLAFPSTFLSSSLSLSLSLSLYIYIYIYIFPPFSVCIAEFAYFRKLCLLFLKTFQSVSLWRNSLATRKIHRYPVAAAIQRNVCLVFVRELASPCVFPLEEQRRETWTVAKILLAVILAERCHGIYGRVKEGWKGQLSKFSFVKKENRYLPPSVLAICRTPTQLLPRAVRPRAYLCDLASTWTPT